ncbi:G-patch domain containing protein [Ditylenchus destructor]|uniref:G-patch domain containing protein n=1 Tax=Ditylenchus destructor TaxID=166010 RepID=A0AAD4MU72_9BILA|nr:G-patch domain containing protein [Ditylenchus destructor]
MILSEFCSPVMSPELPAMSSSKMNYNFGGNFPASMYNLLASGSSGAPGVANPQLYGERLSEQQYSQSQQQRSISPSLNYHQNVEEERASGERKSESWRETERHYSEKSSKKKSRSPDRYYRSDRSSRHRSRSKSRSPSRYSRRRRSRSRSKSRSRERSYRRRSSRSPRRSRDKSKSPSYQRRRSPVECPSLLSPKVMLINLPINADRDTINILIAKQGFHPIDIRIVRKGSDAGNARVFGFVEFSDSAQAQAWITYNNGHLTFDDGYMVKLELSRETEYERRGSSAGTPSSDWTCAKVSFYLDIFTNVTKFSAQSTILIAELVASNVEQAESSLKLWKEKDIP